MNLGTKNVFDASIGARIDCWVDHVDNFGDGTRLWWYASFESGKRCVVDVIRAEAEQGRHTMERGRSEVNGEVGGTS